MPDDHNLKSLTVRRALGRRLREVRLEAALTLPEAAARAGIAAQYLSECERGNRLPSLVKLVDIAAAYDVLVTDLLLDTYPFGSRDRPDPLPLNAPADARTRATKWPWTSRG